MSTCFGSLRPLPARVLRSMKNGPARSRAESYDRCFCPQGMARQLVAILTHGDRGPALASVKAPTLVIHGTDDPLVSVEGGKATAKAVPGAQLMLIEGMGQICPTAGRGRGLSRP